LWDSLEIRFRIYFRFEFVVFLRYFLLDQKVAKKSSRTEAVSGKISLGQHCEKASLSSEMQALFACCHPIEIFLILTSAVRRISPPAAKWIGGVSGRARALSGRGG
jgi:hypothetical protein